MDVFKIRLLKGDNMKKIVMLTEDELDILKTATTDISIELNLLLKYMRANMDLEDMGIKDYGYSRLYSDIESQVIQIDRAREVLYYSK